MADNARQHTAKDVQEHLEKNKDVLKILYLPVATPKLNAVENMWKDAKYNLLTAVSYKTIEELHHAISKYFRARSRNLDIYKFLYRNI